MTQLARHGAGPGETMPRAFTPGTGQEAADLIRIRYGIWRIGAAFVLVGAVFGVAVWQFTAASDVVAVVGSATTIIGTLVGCFFGAHVGSAGKEAAEAGRTQAERAAASHWGSSILTPPRT